jgi:hypothetical protein
MAAAIPDLTVEWTSEDGTPVLMRRARLEDRPALRRLYIAQYGDRYALPEVVDDERSEEVLTGDNWVWLLAEAKGQIVASLIFGWDPVHRLGKSFAGVVYADKRGNKTMHRMLREGLDRLLVHGETFELVYAVVRTLPASAFTMSGSSPTCAKCFSTKRTASRWCWARWRCRSVAARHI